MAAWVGYGRGPGAPPYGFPGAAAVDAAGAEVGAEAELGAEAEEGATVGGGGRAGASFLRGGRVGS